MLNNLVIITSENGGMNEYKYDFFKEGFKEWSSELKARHTPENLKQYLNECGYKIIDIKEVV